jgi:benzoyl-CoA reductase/2-hydroxyglutaryl-CoA dehydratase subunit BcrC/BadD/HgdB
MKGRHIMKASASLSLADLERQIDDRRSQVETLLRKRDQLAQEVERLDAEIQESLTTGGARRRAGRKRVKNEAPLRTVVLEVLRKNKKGLSLKDLAQRVKDTGYKSHSRTFSNVVYQCLYTTPEIVYDDATGLYRIKR